MDSRTKLRESVKIIVGSIVSLFLIAFVLYMAVFTHTLAGRNEGQGELRDLSANRIYKLVENGKTQWYYWDRGSLNDQGEKEELSWTREGYDLSSWKTAKGSFGSLEGQRVEQVDDKAPGNLLNHYLPNGDSIPTYYFRTEFQISDKDKFNSLTGKIRYDDAAILYLNGETIYTSNIPNNGYESEEYGSKVAVEESLTESFVITNLSAIKEGTNVLAVEIHQDNPNSSDVYFEMESLQITNREDTEEILNLSGLVLEVGDSEDSLNVNLLTDVKGALELQYRQETVGATNSGKWSQSYMGKYKTGVDELYTYNARLNGLFPDRVYEYRIKNLATGSISEIKKFRTGETDAFTFAFAGDPQIGSKNASDDGIQWENTLKRGLMMVPNTDFLITAGDQADSSEEEEAMEEFFAFRHPEVMKEIPVAVNRGNHESEGAGMDYQFERFSSSSLHDYYFTYQNTLFYAINTNNKEFNEHIERLRSVIKKTSPRWTVVTMHYSMFGGKDRSEDPTIMRTRKAYAEAFSELNVDLVLSGHDHFYSRSYYMDGEKPTVRQAGYKKNGEVLYLSGGSSTGNKFYTREESKEPFTAFNYMDKRPTITFITIEDTQIILKTYETIDMEVVDQCVLRRS